MTDIKALREKIAAADPLPWGWDSYGTINSIPRCSEYQEFERRHEAAGEPWDAEGNYPEPWKSQEPEIVVCSVKYPGGAANAEAIEAGMNALPALLDELEELRSEAASETRWAEQYKRERDAAEAKLAKVREVFAYEPDDWYRTNYPSYEGYRLRILAILDAEPPTATAQPQDEQGPTYEVSIDPAHMRRLEPTVNLDGLDFDDEPTATETVLKEFQQRTGEWLAACFGDSPTKKDKAERVCRFIEESLELAQSLGIDDITVAEISSYVYSRPVGVPSQEVGGVMVCLAAVCNSAAISLDEAAHTELERVFRNIDKIRQRDKAKPDFAHATVQPTAEGEQ